MLKLFTAGSYVTYGGAICLVTETTGKDSVRVYNHTGTGSNRCVRVTQKNLGLTDLRPAVVLEHSGRDYIVTNLGLIISITSGKAMKWKDNNGNRIKLLHARDRLIQLVAEC